MVPTPGVSNAISRQTAGCGREGRAGMATRYPAIEPYGHGLLDVGDGQRIYWETCGNPAGKPAVVLHGGPGSGCTPGLRQIFDPSAYRIVLVAQRGARRRR